MASVVRVQGPAIIQTPSFSASSTTCFRVQRGCCAKMDPSQSINLFQPFLSPEQVTAMVTTSRESSVTDAPLQKNNAFTPSDAIVTFVEESLHRFQDALSRTAILPHFQHEHATLELFPVIQRGLYLLSRTYSNQVSRSQTCGCRGCCWDTRHIVPDFRSFKFHLCLLFIVHSRPGKGTLRGESSVSYHRPCDAAAISRTAWTLW